MIKNLLIKLVRGVITFLYVVSALGLAGLVVAFSSAWAPIPAMRSQMIEVFQTVHPEEKFLDAVLYTNLLSPTRITGANVWIEPEFAWRSQGSNQLNKQRFRLIKHQDGQCELLAGQVGEPLSESQTERLRATRFYQNVCGGDLLTLAGFLRQ